MKNGGISGIVRDESGVGLAGLEVRVRERGTTVTDATGAFSVRYPGLRRPNLEIEITSVVGRRVAHRIYPAVVESVLDTSWVVARAEAEGWVATGLGAFAPTDGNAVDLLIDNEAAWGAVLDAVNSARESIHFLLFFLDVGHTFLRFDASGVGSALEDALAAAARRGVRVRLMLNDFPTRHTDTVAPVQRAFREVPGVETRRFGVGIAPIHAKLLIVDRMDPERVTALVIGSPFVQDYFAGPEHSLHDPRHGEKRFPQKMLNVPVHDVSLRVRGPTVADLDETFLLHWNQVKPEDGADVAPAPVPPPASAGPGTTIQVTRTLGGCIFPSRPDGEAAIYESYCRAIASAREYVYLENQYFVLDRFTDVLIRAVKRNGIELVLATNNRLDIPLYTRWQRGQVGRLFAGLTPEERERVGVFTVWTHEPGLAPDRPSRVGRIFLHSKVAVVDDRWATVGSANIDGVSLTASDYVRWMRPELRSTEANLVVLGEGAGGTRTDLPARLRQRLWTEHLGLDALPETRPRDGWLSLWNARADAKRASLQAVPAELHRSRILRWPVDARGRVPRGIHRVETYLRALGIVPRGEPPSFESVETFDFHDFETGQWTEAEGT